MLVQATPYRRMKKLLTFPRNDISYYLYCIDFIYVYKSIGIELYRTRPSFNIENHQSPPHTSVWYCTTSNSIIVRYGQPSITTIQKVSVSHYIELTSTISTTVNHHRPHSLVSVPKPAELFLSRRIPHVELDGPTVGVEGQGAHLNAKGSCKQRCTPQQAAASTEKKEAHTAHTRKEDVARENKIVMHTFTV